MRVHECTCHLECSFPLETRRLRTCPDAGEKEGPKQWQRKHPKLRRACCSRPQELGLCMRQQGSAPVHQCWLAMCPVKQLE